MKLTVIKSEIMSKLDLDPQANANENYKILSKIITESKNKHIPKKIKKFDKRKHKKEKWMTNNLLSLVNQKNRMYRDWKSTNNVNEYSKKKINFQTFEKIVDQNIIDAKYFYYHNIFLEQRGDMKKTWATINETLNRSKNRTAFPSNFMINNLSVEDPQEIANHFK